MQAPAKRPSLDEVRASLMRDPEGGGLRDKANAAVGRFGEILVEDWLRQCRRRVVATIPQTPKTRQDYLDGDGKRDDFLITDLLEDGNAVRMVMDAKFHTLGDRDVDGEVGPQTS